MAHVYIESKVDLNELAEQIVHNFGMASDLNHSIWWSSSPGSMTVLVIGI